jgi:hypothetical protein
MERTRNVDILKNLTFKCDLGCNNQTIGSPTSFHNGYHLCQVTKKKIQRFKLWMGT